MDSPLNISVSCFKNYSTVDDPRTVNMLSWLRSAKYAEQVQMIRSIDDKKERDKIKATLPAITPSGTFHPTRAEKNLVQHSGLIQFDIDLDHNRHITNFDKLKEQIQNIENVAYCGLSVSGKGYWGLVPIAFPDKHKSQFRALYKGFKKFGLTIDKAPQNVASLRGYSFDPELYINHNAKPFEHLDQPARPEPIRRTHFDNDTRSDVEALIQQIQSQRIDITPGYDEWLKIGFALSDEFGESGREYFHIVSQFHSEYNERECDRQYDHCLRSNGDGVTIATFFHLCKQYGIELKRISDSYPSYQKDRSSQAKYESQNSDNLDKTPIQAGYPAEWDEIDKPEPGTPEDIESARATIQDAEPDELQTLMQNDPALRDIVGMFNCELSQN